MCVCVCVRYNWKENSTDCHYAIIKLFRLAALSSLPHQITLFDEAGCREQTVEINLSPLSFQL